MATFAELIHEMNGYECKTTLWDDFSVADGFGPKAVRDTFDRVFKEWGENVEYMTELSLVLNHKIWQHHEKNEELAETYGQLWDGLDEYCLDCFDGEDKEYYFKWTD